jgi:hypothetical protein
MKRLEIPPDEWQRFLESFVGQHEGWLIGVDRFEELLDGTSERHHSDGVLREIQLTETRDRSVDVAIDDRASGHLEKESIQAPCRILLEQIADDIDAGLEIDGAQSCLILRFRSPMPADMVDGVAHVSEHAQSSEPRADG